MMKYKSIGIVFIFLIGSFNVSAAIECKTKLTKQDRYNDLNKVLQCLSSKMQKLEQQMLLAGQNNTSPIQTSANKGVVENSRKPANYLFEDENFLVTLKWCKKKGKKISCSVEFENPSDTNVNISIFKSGTFIVNEDGERWDYKGNTAIRGSLDINKKTFLPTNFTFDSQGSMAGERFNLFIRYYSGKPFKITFNNVYLK